MRARRTSLADGTAIQTLLQSTGRAFPRVWWWEEHLGEPSFVVAEWRQSVVGALFAWPDQSPVAWVRLAALRDDLSVDRWLDVSLPPILRELRRLGTRTLAWMDHRGWVGGHLRTRGFEPFVEVMTLVKRDPELPDRDSGEVRLRQASDEDLAAVVAVDRAAFAPHWWQSEDTVQRRATASSYFTVADFECNVVGYAQAELQPPKGHLNRIAVHPAHQNRGIGAALLHDALHALWASGAERVLLNTQRGNRRSLQLYRRFGFEPTGDVVTAWETELQRA